MAFLTKHDKRIQQPKPKLRVTYLNARSVNSKRNVLMKIIEEENPDTLAITEHWLNKEQIEAYVLDGYKKLSYTPVGKITGEEGLYY